MPRLIKYSEAILEATDQMMAIDPSVYVIGLGVPDPKGIFGTTLDLQKKYGSSRVMDMPTSENAMTGIVTGSSIVGMRPIMTHQRVDFFLLGLDQLINNSAKWHYMFGGQMKAPMVIRLIMGRGWGQGPQHSQTLQSLFAHIPGLKVVMPSSSYDAKGLLVAAIKDDNPVVYLEHRWLHNSLGDVPEDLYEVPIGKAKVVQEGSDVTVVSLSMMTAEAIKAQNLIQDVSMEIIDLRSVKPFDKETIMKSLRKTGRLLVLDPDWKTGGFASEIIASCVEEDISILKEPPARLTYPDTLSPTSWALSNHYYPTSKDVALKVLEICNKRVNAATMLKEILEMKLAKPHDVPDKEFSGPF